jgi:hypothetical protein
MIIGFLVQANLACTITKQAEGQWIREHINSCVCWNMRYICSVYARDKVRRIKVVSVTWIDSQVNPDLYVSSL